MESEILLAWKARRGGKVRRSIRDRLASEIVREVGSVAWVGKESGVTICEEREDRVKVDGSVTGARPSEAACALTAGFGSEGFDLPPLRLKANLELEAFRRPVILLSSCWMSRS